MSGFVTVSKLLERACFLFEKGKNKEEMMGGCWHDVLPTCHFKVLIWLHHRGLTRSSFEMNMKFQLDVFSFFIQEVVQVMSNYIQR